MRFTRKRVRLVLCLAVILLLQLYAVSEAAVLRVEIDSREPVLGGKVFGQYGAYELIKGRMFFGFDRRTMTGKRARWFGTIPIMVPWVLTG